MNPKDNKRKDAFNEYSKVERIGLITINQLMNNRPLRRKLRGTDLEKLIMKIIHE